MKRLPFYLVEISPWPITTAVRRIIITIGIINWFHSKRTNILIIRIIIIIIRIYQWWRDISREATYIGKHTSHTQNSLRLGIILFITREICFFCSFFWSFFHIRISPSIEIGAHWPPIGIQPIDPIRIPLLNTATLLFSGFLVTWSHHKLIIKKLLKSSILLIITIIIGIYFSYLQITEYNYTSFRIADSVFGSTFFIITGFHGIHVIIGSLFLLSILTRILNNHFSRNHHFGFEAAAWYWHFVDVVWILLYISIYWWGSL